MKTEDRKNILEDLIHIATLSENLYLQRELENIQEIIKTTADNFELGSTLRRLL
jgi:hypothetical protein